MHYHVWTVNHRQGTASKRSQEYATPDEAQIAANDQNEHRRKQAREQGFWAHPLPCLARRGK